jgi:gluconokinase
MASGTGLLNVHTRDWDAELLEVVGIDPTSLGPVVPLLPVGTANRWSQLKDAPWIPAVGDGACSNVGAGCTSPEHFALMVGTSGAERAVWAPKDDFTIPWGAWCYRVDERRVALGGALNDGGSLLDWLHASLQLPDLQLSEQEIGELEPDGHGLTVLPYWGGERNPNWADDARGAIVGMRLATRPLDILRACLEGVALRFAEMDHILRQALPESREIIATGGALLHSPAWMQIIADALGQPLLASVETEASSRGAALLTLEALGLLATPLDAMTPDVSRRFEPVAAHTDRYRAALQRQRRLYDALLR